MALASISVDLDSLHHYARIHGLAAAAPAEDSPVYRRAVPRLLELLARRGVPCTFFAIGEDVEQDPAAPQALRDALAAGGEVASHSYAHDYALTRAAPERIAEDLARADAALEAATGARPIGFRAPGYTLNAALYQATCARGYRYGSSVFPAAPYYLAKAGVMGLMRLTGRRSAAVLDAPSVLAAPRTPYRPDPGAPYRRGRGPVLELPITVTPRARLPFIGTFVTRAPAFWVRRALRSLRGEPLFNFELHAVDLLDADDGIDAGLVRRQPDLAVPLSRKRERLDEVFSWLCDHYEVVTLAKAAERLASAV